MNRKERADFENKLYCWPGNDCCVFAGTAPSKLTRRVDGAAGSSAKFPGLVDACVLVVNASIRSFTKARELRSNALSPVKFVIFVGQKRHRHGQKQSVDDQAHIPYVLLPFEHHQ